MSKSDIITEANKLCIVMSKETFDSVHKLNPDNKLLSNACMYKDCPKIIHISYILEQIFLIILKELKQIQISFVHSIELYILI
jgi:hypothetical protein